MNQLKKTVFAVLGIEAAVGFANLIPASLHQTEVRMRATPAPLPTPDPFVCVCMPRVHYVLKCDDKVIQGRHTCGHRSKGGTSVPAVLTLPDLPNATLLVSVKSQ